MKKLGLVITDGVGFRNFILSDFLLYAKESFDEVVILSCLPKETYKDHTSTRVIELDVFEETFKTWFFRKAKEIAHLKLHQNGNLGIQDNLKTNYSKFRTTRGYATRIIYKLTTVWYSEKSIQRLQKFQNATFSNHVITKDYISLLEKEQFNLLFFTHQRPPYIAPLVYATQKIRIKTAAFIFSWDNLASKGRMAANFDYYLVWSNLMKQDLLQFYSAIKAEQIKEVGTPQFVPYVMSNYKVSKSEFIKYFNLDTNLKTICFSCGDISTSKNDELYIETIASAIVKKDITLVNFIVRTSPAEDPIRFQNLVEKFPFIKWNFPKWIQVRANHQESWSQRIPTIDDVRQLRALLEYSDLNINMLSTMSLDFMLFDKPVINPVFGNENNELYDDQRFLGYAHIQHLVNSKSSKIVKNTKELIQAISDYLNNDKDYLNRKNFIQQQVGVSLGETNKRLVSSLKSWT
ncbi:CDP-glycerol glycerophosphotransferase family protein [Tamlana sp. 2_MG-2023]|uniref:CDP-glycerol glycerophosphotransferase family protein n=1 Tax=unclassified Tamlana TaxID=2614803 RepID=UPI0026E2A11A|nr:MULTISPECIES: CDP-glycerol glycerophosphotransferase family protein [unclassified Tamlana]MDO6758759.1 CDP-glycerol glycerophosphotransferase family protein [Tamlana sp. 2_MG-2023]MDO6789458.1 CDP-glycerol glycerophosphotransferase family protein [Tamlana sp. 1_MG-2023]